MKGEALREVRAIQILELIGNTKAKQILKNLASGAPGVGLTSEAKLALQRLNE